MTNNQADTTIKIKDRIIGTGYPTYMIAEMSANHAGSLERAKEIVHAAKEAGADCLKIQTYTPDTLTINCHNKYFQVKNGTWEGENLYGLYGKAYTPWEWQPILKEEADKVGIDFLSTPFDVTAVDFLEKMGLEFYKIASFEMIDIPLLKYVASKQKPIIMSTGMASLEEIKEAVAAIRSEGNNQIALMKCSSAYPAAPEQMHLQNIADMQIRFGLPVGLSDHSMGHMSAMTAVALGASVIEKHFCLSRDIENPDASFSMTPTEFKEMVTQIRDVEKAIGNVFYGVTSQEESSMVFRRSIFVTEPVKKGEIFTRENTRIIRPGYGLKPKYYEDILGLQAGEDVERGTPFSYELTEKHSILFLTNNDNTMPLYEWLKKQKESVILLHEKITLDIIKQIAPAYVISFNYKYLVPEDVLEYCNGKIVNLHISYLPYNKGASPNFFSFYENTPKGVTIHEMTTGLDEGALLLQKEVEFDESSETFATAYDKLIAEMIELFKQNWSALKEGQIVAKPQTGDGTYHTAKELKEIREKYPFQWTDCIADWKRQNHLV